MSVLLFAFVSASSGCASSTPPGTIGAVLGKGNDDGRVFVRRIPAGEGADKASLEVDDEIIAIDGHPVLTMSTDEVRAAVRGNSGTIMVVTIERGGHRRDVKVQRTPLLPQPAAPRK